MKTELARERERDARAHTHKHFDVCRLNFMHDFKIKNKGKHRMGVKIKSLNSRQLDTSINSCYFTKPNKS